MARYIDADAFEEFIKRKYKDGESTDDIKDQMLFDLSYQPTAYDPDAVVKQLEDASHWEEPTYDEDGYCNDDSWEVVYLDKAIEIVRNAGKDGAE